MQCDRIPTEWIIQICDNGIGIVLENLERVFNILETIHANEYEDAGVGLAICKSLVQNYQKAIGIKNEVGNSSFYVTLEIRIISVDSLILFFMSPLMVETGLADTRYTFNQFT